MTNEMESSLMNVNDSLVSIQMPILLAVPQSWCDCFFVLKAFIIQPNHMIHLEEVSFWCFFLVNVHARMQTLFSPIEYK